MITTPPKPDPAPTLADLAGPTPPDLLPPEYRRAIHRRGVLRRRVVMLLGTLIIILPFIHRAAGERSALIDRRQHLIEAAETGRQIADQLPALQADYDSLVRIATLIEHNNPPIDYSQVITAIGRTLSTADALRDLQMQTSQTEIDLDWTVASPTAADAGRLIERLSHLPILDGYTPDPPITASLDGLSATLLRSRAAVPLDRNYAPIAPPPAALDSPSSAPADSPDPEVTHAAP